MITVSICIPSYNDEIKVKRLLDSIENQLFKDYEIIITDDSDTNEIAKIAKDYPKVSYYKNEKRLGATANCNAAIKKSVGKYIKIMHHDDWFSSKDSLGSLVKLMEENKDVLLGFCGTWQVSNNEKYSRYTSASDAAMYRKDYRTLFLRNKIGAPSATIIRNQNFLFDENLTWLVDTELYLNILSFNNNFVFTKEPWVCIGMGEEQLTNSCIRDIQLQIKEYQFLYQKYQLFRNNQCKLFFTQKMLRLGCEYKKLPKNYLSKFEIIKKTIRSICGKINKQFIEQFIKFGIVGGLNTLLTYIIYYMGISCGLHYVISNAIAFVITVFISYLLNNKFVFKGEHKTRSDWLKALLRVYLSYASTSLILSTILLALQVEVLNISKELAPLLNLFVTVPINFMLNKFWAFRKKTVK